ncbi:UDP-N-acetylmuramoylalanyl-D-glutamyl-2, 6-diaminopimelate--D-alanyl-D-alanine ligase domain protein, partial [Neisseria meningitidis 2004090]
MSAQNYARELEQARAEAKKYEVKAHAVGMALAKKQAEVSRLKTENKRKSKMSLLKTVKMQATVVLTALAITACSSTSAPSATEIKVVEKAVMPTPPAALMVAPVRPNPPKDGKTATLLEHAAEFGGYVAELEKSKSGLARLG